MNKYQELQQQNIELKETVRSLQQYHSNINNYRSIKRYEASRRLRTIDWSLNQVIEQRPELGEGFKATPLYCDCKQCAGHNRLLDWPKRSLVKWNNEPGVCPFVVALQLARIAMLRHEPIDPFIVGKLLRIARQL